MEENPGRGGLRRRKRKIGHAQPHGEEYQIQASFDTPEREPKRTANPLPPKFGFLHLVSLMIEKRIVTIVPGVSKVMNRFERIGSGGTFLVYKADLNLLEDIPKMGFSEGTASDGCVLKRTRANPLCREEGVDAEASRYAAIIAELQLLTHPPIAEHENIVTFLGLAWDLEVGPNDTSSVWPVLVLESAAESSLDEYSKSEGNPENWGMGVCRDIARGLVFLHDRGIVHCDVKAENVLICNRGTAEVLRMSDRVAKLSDFGCALLDITPKTELPHGLAGTCPWNAPEYRQHLVGLEIFKTDVYSFGMLMWRLIAPNERFQQLDSCSLSADEKRHILREIETVKLGENFFEMALDDAEAKGEELRTDSTLSELGLEPILDSHALCSLLKILLPSVPSQRADMNKVLTILEPVALAEQSFGDSQSERSGESPSPAPEIPDPRIADGNDNESDEDSWTGGDGNKAEDDERMYPVVFPDSPFCEEFHTVYEWYGKEADEVKAQLVVSLSRCFSGEYGTAEDSKTAAYYLAICYFEAFGVEEDWVKSYDWLRQSAYMGSVTAGKAIFRAELAANPSTMVPQEQTIEWLAQATSHGSLQAATDLQTLDINAYQDAISIWRQRFCTVEDGDSVPSQDELMAIVTNMARLHPSFDQPLNKRGYQALHLASSLGFIDVVTLAGKGTIALWLLTNGADTIVSEFGQSPLHWLIAVDDDCVQELGRLLVENGAALECECEWLEDNGYLFDQQHHGTPIYWAVREGRIAAVRALVELGADPFNDCTLFSPFALAVANHQAQVVRQLLQSKHSTPSRLSDITSIGTSILFHTVRCNGKFERMMTNGGDLQDNARETLRLLFDNGCNPSIIDDKGNTILHAACAFSDIEIVQLLLDDFGMDQYINTCCGGDGHTPLLTAVEHSKLPAVKLLLSRGADTYRRFLGVPLLHLCAVARDEKFLIKCLEAIGLPGRRDLDVLASHDDDSDRFTAFDSAVLVGNLDIARMFIAAGAKPPPEDPARAGALLSALISSGRWKSTQSIQYLLENDWGSFILEQDSQTTALHLTADQSPCHLAKRMLDPLTSEKNFALILTAFSLPEQVNACTRGCEEYAAGTTPLHRAATAGFYYAARKLLESGARTDTLDSDGNTPLGSLVRLLSYLEEADRELRPIGSDFMTGLRDTAKLLRSVVSGSGFPMLEKRNEDVEVLRFSRLGFGCEG
ncbi:hypothetical protein BDD12DRAFT_913185 [Trichophaea hybrida]|nr:hypothetical protein BDD12DRAFT_913185 [Trichophaea hybrida]